MNEGKGVCSSCHACLKIKIKSMWEKEDQKGRKERRKENNKGEKKE